MVGGVAHVGGAEADADLPALVGALVARRVIPDVVAPLLHPLLLRLLLEQLLKVLLRPNKYLLLLAKVGTGQIDRCCLKSLPARDDIWDGTYLWMKVDFKIEFHFQHTHDVHGMGLK